MDSWLASAPNGSILNTWEINDEVTVVTNSLDSAYQLWIRRFLASPRHVVIVLCQQGSSLYVFASTLLAG